MQAEKLNDSQSLLMDLIRLLASQLVVFGHGIGLCNVLPSLLPPNFPYFQSLAVITFFILSGFLIPYSVDQKINVLGYSIKNYFIDRFVRIYAVLVPSLVFIFIIDYFILYYNFDFYKHLDDFNLKTFVFNVLSLQGFPKLGIEAFGTGRPLWTLSIEWWLYMSFGIIVFYTSIQSKKKMFFLFLLGICLILPISNLFNSNKMTFYWLFGWIIFMLYKNKIGHNIKSNLLTYLIVILSILLGYVWNENRGAYSLLTGIILSCIINFLIILFKRLDILSKIKKVIRAINQYSYSIYLIHYSVFSIVLSLQLKINNQIIFIIGFILSNIIALLFGWLFENKFSRFLKHKLINSINAN